MTVADIPHDTVADLLARLGGVPAHRVLLKPTPGTATEADVTAAMKLPRKRVCELIDGVRVEKAVGDRESLLAGYIIRLLWNHIEPNDLGVVLAPDGFLWLSGKQLRAPDVSFIPWSTFPDGEPPEEAYLVGRPGPGGRGSQHRQHNCRTGPQTRRVVRRRVQTRLGDRPAGADRQDLHLSETVQGTRRDRHTRRRKGATRVQAPARRPVRSRQTP